MFTISNLTAYVTEKLYTGYFAGVIPVYWGSPLVTEVAPKGSFINANDYASATDLAKDLVAIANDYDRYPSLLTRLSYSRVS